MNDEVEKDDSLGQGVYYARADYIGLGVRFAIIAIDLIVLSVIFLLALVQSMVMSPDLDERAFILNGRIPAILAIYLYLVLMKRTKFRTIGYRVLRARVVNLEGDQPSVWQMTLRFLLFALGPLDFVLDTFWLGGDENRQTFRDKLAGTYVIRDTASPAGEGTIELIPYDILGWGLLFREVRRP